MPRSHIESVRCVSSRSRPLGFGADLSLLLAEIDCRRTDRTHPMFASDDEDFNQADSPHPPSNAHVKSTQEILLSYVFTTDSRDYVQGMSDLLSPIYVVCEGDQVMAYWAFETLMERMKGNFLRDQSGMKGQLTLLQGLLRTMDVQLYKHLGELPSPPLSIRRAELTLPSFVRRGVRLPQPLHVLPLAPLQL